MIFSEIYGVYYNAVAEILKEAANHPLQENELRQIIKRHAFEESILNIEPALKEGRWQLLKADGTTPIVQAPTMPLTRIQKRWLKAISLDPRIRLFQDKVIDFPDIKPLFTKDDYDVFDQYVDGDPYEDADYIARFRLILDAIKNRYPLDIEMESGKGKAISLRLLPEYLEYSEKDDKFRLIGSDGWLGGTVNLGRIISCKRCENNGDVSIASKLTAARQTVTFELVDQRNALERVLLHFAHFEKQAKRLDSDRYRVTVKYEKDDETEMVIRILSFGPMVKVVAPVHFINLIKERLISQKSWGQ